MRRFALLLALPLLACGDSVATETSSETTAPVTTTGEVPTTGTTGTADATTTTGDGPETTGSGGQTGSTSSGSSTGATTEAVEPDSSSSGSSSTGDGTTGTGGSTSTGEDSTTSTGEDSSSGSSSSESTGDDTGGMQPVVEASCVANDLSTFVEPMAFDHELHIIGVYQPTAGAITVHVDRVGIPITLVLSSYEPVNFTLVLAPGVELVEVILNGYNFHTVMGQGGATVTDLSGVGNYLSACGYIIPDNQGGCDTAGLIAGAENLTGLTLQSFAGCYEGSEFTLQ
jgi:hypothetical protein